MCGRCGDWRRSVVALFCDFVSRRHGAVLKKTLRRVDWLELSRCETSLNLLGFWSGRRCEF